MMNKKSIGGSQLVLEIYERFECILFLSADKYNMIFPVANAKVDQCININYCNTTDKIQRFLIIFCRIHSGCLTVQCER